MTCLYILQAFKPLWYKQVHYGHLTGRYCPKLCTVNCWKGKSKTKQNTFCFKGRQKNNKLLLESIEVYNTQDAELEYTAALTENQSFLVSKKKLKKQNRSLDYQLEEKKPIFPKERVEYPSRTMMLSCVPFCFVWIECWFTYSTESCFVMSCVISGRHITSLNSKEFPALMKQKRSSRINLSQHINYCMK